MIFFGGFDLLQSLSKAPKAIMWELKWHLCCMTQECNYASPSMPLYIQISWIESIKILSEYNQYLYHQLLKPCTLWYILVKQRNRHLMPDAISRMVCLVNIFDKGKWFTKGGDWAKLGQKQWKTAQFSLIFVASNKSLSIFSNAWCMSYKYFAIFTRWHIYWYSDW